MPRRSWTRSAVRTPRPRSRPCARRSSRRQSSSTYTDPSTTQRGTLMNRLIPSRRDMLRLTLSGFGYTALSGLSASAATRELHFPARARRVILLYMQGGVSHLDTFDYKPRLQADHGKELAAG